MTRKLQENYMKYKENQKATLISCGMLLINEIMMTILKNCEKKKLGSLMDEMLHSIFFLGYIFDNKFETEVFQRPLKDLFPEPFEKYNSHLPRRTPFSILLNMMEILYCTEDRIKEELLILLRKLNFRNPLHKPGSKTEQYYTLESTVICVCYSAPETQKYFGASLSCRRGPAKRILIDLSCLQTWHDYVSHAVMSFYKGDNGDGITFDKSVKCQAYKRDWNKNVYREEQPCKNCKNLFNLQDANLDRVYHPYGNCAETEALSKLLRINRVIEENAVISNHTQDKLERLRNATKARLAKELIKVGININDNNFLFYEPSKKDLKALLDR